MVCSFPFYKMRVVVAVVVGDSFVCFCGSGNGSRQNMLHVFFEVSLNYVVFFFF